METRKLLFGAMGLLLMASCAKDEVVSVNRDGDEIAFSVTTNAGTRVNTQSGGVYCNNNLPGAFRVWAVTEDKKTHIDGDVIQKTNPISPGDQQGPTWVNQGGTRYWPEGTLDFYAAVNAASGDQNYNFSWNNDNAGTFSAPTIAVTVPTGVADQKDLLYAVKTGLSKKNPNQQVLGLNDGYQINRAPNVVNLNFRHALSQVVFTAQNVNPKLHIEIEGVTIGNVMSHSVFTYPTSSTESNINPHDNISGNDAITEYNETWGTWATPDTRTNYSVSFNPVTIPGDENPNTPSTSLTNEGVTPNEYNANAMLLLPQTSTAWDTATASVKKPADEDQTGTYFLVKCLIYNIAGDAVNKETDICLWGNKEGEGIYTAKNIAMPVALNWTQGKKYIYNFILGLAGSGVDPENPENPILVPINFSVITVDEFMSGGTGNIPTVQDSESELAQSGE